MKIKISKSIFHYFWVKESGLTGMLVMICILNFIVIPVFGEYRSIHSLVIVFWMLFIFAGIGFLAKSRRQVLLLSLIPGIFIIFGWIMVFNHGILIRFTEFFLGICVYLLIIGMVLIKVFEEGPVTYHRIIGAVVVYMLIGNLFSNIFTFIQTEFPGSFNISLNGLSNNSFHSTFLYFSFTTLTTTGFGDVTPLRTLTRNLVVIEQLIGVMYPIILIGRIVSLGIMNKSREK